MPHSIQYFKLLLDKPMFVERKVRYSALFTNLVGWHTAAVSFPLSDVILAQLACPLSDIKFCLHSGRTNLSLYNIDINLGVSESLKRSSLLHFKCKLLFQKVLQNWLQNFH